MKRGAPPLVILLAASLGVAGAAVLLITNALPPDTHTSARTDCTHARQPRASRLNGAMTLRGPSGSGMEAKLEAITEAAEYVVVATVTDVEAGRWNTPDGCRPDRYREGDPSQLYYQPVRVRVERVLINRADPPPGAEYIIEATPPQPIDGSPISSQGPMPCIDTLAPGRYVLYGSPSHDGGEEADRIRLHWNMRIGGDNRVQLYTEEPQPLDQVVARIHAVAGPRALTPAPDPLTVMPKWEHANLIKFGGITCSGTYWNQDSALRESSLGPEYGRVQADADSVTMDTDRDQMRSGDATGLPEGTPVYSVKGYAPESRLAARAYGRIYLYEAYIVPNASKGSDLLDLADKVRSIRVATSGDYQAEPVTIEDPQLIEALVRLVLEAPVKPSPPDYEHDVTYYYGITFRMADGTDVESFYYADTNELGRGLHPSPAFRKLIERELRRGQHVPTEPTDTSICRGEAVEEARRRWRESGPRSYNLWVTVGGTSQREIGGWYLEVREGVLARARRGENGQAAEKGVEVASSKAERYRVESLLDELARGCRRAGDGAIVDAYISDNGFPSYYKYDHLQVNDEEVTWEAILQNVK